MLWEFLLYMKYLEIRFMKQRNIILLISLLLSSCIFIPYVIPFNDLPEPTGTFNVGTQVFEWIDVSREEWFTQDSTDLRRLVVQAWYPTIDIKEDGYPYLDFPEKRIIPIAKRISLPPYLLSHIGNIKTNSILNATILENDIPYPLVLFSHGLGGMRMQNTVQMEELASRGYIVVSLDHTYDANVTVFLDGTTAAFRSYLRDEATEEEFWEVRLPQVNTRASDISFIIDKISEMKDKADKLFKHADLSKIGVLGHSFGGATAIVASYNDNRINACINLDGWMEPVKPEIIQSGLKIPFLYIGQEKWDDTPLNHVKLDSLILSSSGSKELIVGAKHFDYSDTPQLNKVASKLDMSGDIDMNILREKINSEIVLFFNKYIKNSN